MGRESGLESAARDTTLSDDGLQRADSDFGMIRNWDRYDSTIGTPLYDWGKTEEAALAYFREHEVRGFILQSSCGMDGWVLAKSMEKISRDGHVEQQRGQTP